MSRLIGRGKLLWGIPLDDVLRPVGVRQDFQYTSVQAQANIDYIHRRVGDADVYSVSNQLYRDEVLSCTFRVSGKIPELWQPETGEIRKVALYTQENGCTHVPLRMGPAESGFVVFRETARTESVVSVMRSGTPVGSDLELSLGNSGSIEGTAWESGRYTLRDSHEGDRKIESKVPSPITIEGPWDASIPRRAWARPRKSN